MKTLDNLLILAKKSCSAGDYAKAEKYCEKVIMNDENNFDAWKTKAIAVNMQTSADKSRMQEVFNCLMKAYRVSEDKEKEKKGKEIIDLLKNAINNTVSFYFTQLENSRPTDFIISQIKNIYNQAEQMLRIAFVETRIDDYDEYITEFTLKFIAQSTLTCLHVWEKTVAYNYYRTSYSENLSLLKYNYNAIWRDEYYRPSIQILKSFIEETNCLIKLSVFSTEIKTPKISAQVLLGPCENIVIFNNHLIEARYYDFVYSEIKQKYVWRVVGLGLTENEIKDKKDMVDKYKLKMEDFNIELQKSSF